MSRWQARWRWRCRRRARLARSRPIRQGYQTNIWGMPTYYLLKSGLLEKRGIKFEEFAVPSGNLTMQQMVARQVDLGTYAGQSFIIGHDKGGLVAIAQIETVGKTAQVVTRKDLDISKVEQLKGLKVANQTGSSVGNIFMDIIAPAAGLKKGDFQEVRMDVNNMVAAHGRQDRGRHGQRRALQRDRRRRGHRHLDHGFLAASTRCRCSWRRRPISSTRAPTRSSPISRPGRRWRATSRTTRQGGRRDLRVLHLEGLHHVARDLRQGAGARRGQSGLSRRPRAELAEATPRFCCGRRRSPPFPTGRRRCGPICGPGRPADEAHPLAFPSCCNSDAGRLLDRKIPASKRQTKYQTMPKASRIHSASRDASLSSAVQSAQELVGGGSPAIRKVPQPVPVRRDPAIVFEPSQSARRLERGMIRPNMGLAVEAVGFCV